LGDAQGAVVLQLFPYGWLKSGIEVAGRRAERETAYTGMVEAVNCSYVRWVNHRPENAFLRK
jgi:hypothetical protein